MQSISGTEAGPALPDSRMDGKRPGYLPSLDGWRCVAIVGVLWAHDFHFAGPLGRMNEQYHLVGGFGVALFYALSGYLIAYRIVLDEGVTGRFRLRDFYLRRFFRIQPAQWVFLAFVAGLMLLRVVHVTWRYWMGALFCMRTSCGTTCWIRSR